MKGMRHYMLEVDHGLQKMRHWMLEEPWVAEGETGDAGGEALDAGE